MPLSFQLRDGHQQRFTCGSQHRPPSFDGTYTLFVPSSEVVPERLALLLAARCDSTAYGEQYRTVDGPIEQRTDKEGLLLAPEDAKMPLRRVTDSILSSVGSLGTANPTDAFFIPLVPYSCKGYIYFAACLLRLTVSPLSLPSVWGPFGGPFYCLNSTIGSRWTPQSPTPSTVPGSAWQ